MEEENRYSKGKIYKLINSIDEEEYVGSTCNELSKRLYMHKNKAKSMPNIKVYKHLNQVGFDNVRIILVEEYNCQSKMELERREAHWIRELKPSLNCVIPRRTFQERYEANKEAIAAKGKKWYEENKERHAEKSKQYREKHKDAIAEWGKQYREANKDRIKEHKSTKVQCPHCDKQVTRDKLNRHIKTQHPS